MTPKLKQSPRVERAAKVIRDALAVRLVGRNGPPITEAQVDHMADLIVTRLVPHLFCDNCPDIPSALDGHGARRTGGGA